MLKHGFWWDDDDLDAEDIKALVLQRKRRLQQKLQSTRSLMRAEEDGRPKRVGIPTELRRVVLVQPEQERLDLMARLVSN